MTYLAIFFGLFAVAHMAVATRNALRVRYDRASYNVSSAVMCFLLMKEFMP